MDKRKIKSMTIDEGFKALQDILDNMDEDGVGLEEAFKLYNDGLLLVKELNGKLTDVQQRLTIVNQEEQPDE